MPRWTEEQLREAVAAADSFTEVLHRFELRSAGGNFQQLNVWLARWAISTEHFTHGGDRLAPTRRKAVPLETVLVEHSTYKRGLLKSPRESPGRLSELQRNASDTLRREPTVGARAKVLCALQRGVSTEVRIAALLLQELCFARQPAIPAPRRAPTLRAVATSSWSAVGRKYGVSWNAVRKWVQMEQRLRAEAAEAAACGEKTAGEPERRRGAA